MRCKLPPFGKALVHRQAFKNPPDFVFVFCGLKAWDEARALQARFDVSAMVLNPNVSPHDLAWPVQGCLCLISWNVGPDEQTIIELVRALLKSGAVSVTTWPRWIDCKSPSAVYDESRPVGMRWVQVREIIRTYRGKNAAR